MAALEDLADWERLLAAERHLQALLPDAVLVGGTAAALHAGHRRSLDGDHVLEGLRDQFDEVLARLESAAGWTTAPWNDWTHLRAAGRRHAAALAGLVLGGAR